MTTRTFSLSGSMAGLGFAGPIARTGATETDGSLTLAAGASGTLSTRTDNTTGVITADVAGHGILTGDTVDVYWGGTTPGVHRGMVVGTVAGTTVPITGGIGDNLPVAGTAVVFDKQETLDFDSVFATIVMAAVSQQRRSSVQFQQEVGTVILALDLGRYGQGEPWLWTSGGNFANPFAAAIGKVVASNGDSAGTNVVSVAVMRST